ncbi:hypothetical protein DW841_13970, partial [Hungatella hathewayi]
MRKHRFAVYAVMTATVLFSAMAGTFVSALANSAEVKRTTVNGNPATPGNASSDTGNASSDTDTETASDTEKGTETETGDSTDQNRATPGNAASDPDRGDGKGAESPAESDGILYTVSSYDFWCLSQPMLVKMGAEFNPDAEQLPICIDVYLEGPDGFLYDPLWLAVDWDLSGVDFNREGEYRVTGILDTASCEVPVDWDHAPLLSFIIKVDQGGTLSFTPETDGNILTLSYVMNGDPYTISDLNYELYESRDGGTNWRNITRDNRVWAEEDHLTISGVEEDSLFQVTDLRLGGVLSYHSDIVKADIGGDGMIETVSIIPSDGEMGGADWGNSNWDDDPSENGPYQILDYRIGNPYVYDPLPLIARAAIGCQEDIAWGFYNTISVFYGDKPNGLWKAKKLIPVEWNQDELDAVDWNRKGDTIIHGEFSDEMKEEYGYLLKFESMPELTLTISIYSENCDFVLSPSEDTPEGKNQVKLNFFSVTEKDTIPLTFDDLTSLTVWCSTDWGENWYDITDSSSTALRNDSLSVSYLKDTSLDHMGYSFQIEQAEASDLERYSAYVTVTHNAATGRFEYSTDIGGDRGGGKRFEKPPEGLFDKNDEGDRPDSNPTEPTTEAPTVPPTEAPTIPPTEAPTAPPTEAPTAPPTNTPTAPPSGTPTVPPTNTSAAPPTEAPTIPPTNTPADPPNGTPTVPPNGTPTAPPTKTTERNASKSGGGKDNTSESGTIFTVPNKHDDNPYQTAVLKPPAPVSQSENVSDPTESVSDIPANAPANTVKETVPDKTDEIHTASPRSLFLPLRLLVGIAAVSGGA